MRKQSKQKKQNKSRNVTELRSTHPPPLSRVNLTTRKRMRFIAGSAFDGAISWEDLLDTFLQAATATQGYKLFDAVRIIEVEIWHSPMSSSVSTVLVDFLGLNVGQVGDQEIHSDSSMGWSPAHVRARPKRTSQSAQWQPSSASSAIRITAPSGSVIDIVLDFRSEFNSAVTCQNALVGATAGGVYLRGLDGNPVASTVLMPAVPAAWIR